jgi:hypothetical protein
LGYFIFAFGAQWGISSHRPGVTNKKEWDTFSREILSKKKFPVKLTEHLQRDKVEVFNIWLQNGKDLHEFLGPIFHPIKYSP